MSKAFVIIVFLSGFHIPTYANEKEDLRKLGDKINSLDDAGEYHLVIENALKLYDLASKSTSDSLKMEYRCLSYLFLLDRYKGADVVVFEKTFNKFKSEIENKLFISYRIQYGYLINYYELLKIHNNYADILKVLEQTEKLILKYQYVRSGREFCWRMQMVYTRRGDVYLKENNFRNAQVQYELALSYALKTDALYYKAEHKFWGYQRVQLIKLFSLAAITNDKPAINKYTQQLNQIKKKSLYDKLWNKELIENTLKNKDITRDQINRILTQMESNELLSNSPQVFMDISQYFLDSDYILEATRYKNRALALLPAYLNQPSVNIQFALLQASLELKNCNYKAMDSLIQSSKDLLMSDEDKNTNSVIPGKLMENLSFMQKATALYNQAYKNSEDTAFIGQGARLDDKAIHILNALRMGLSGEADRTHLLTQLTDLCKGALFNYSELAKIHNLSDLQLNSVLNFFEANKAFNLLINRQFKNTLSARENAEIDAIENEIDRINNTLSTSIDFSDSLTNLKRELLDSSRNKYESAILKSRFKPALSIQMIQNRLLSDQSLIEFFNADTNMYVLLINQNEVIFKSIVSNRKNGIPGLDELLVKLGQYIYEGSDQGARPLKEYSKAAYQIYTLLISPIVNKLKNKIIIIPETNMSTLPWAALLTEQPSTTNCKKWPYWVKTHTIATQHSLSLWLNDGFSEETTGENKFKISFSGFAPYFDNLNYNQAECNDLKNLMQGNAYLSEDANLKKFTDCAHNSRILHVSSHAKASPINQDSSYIRLQDDILYSGEIKRISIPTDLVFLSACETGIGQMISAEGVMSLARSFFTAGARSVISTLWKVNDKSTSSQVKLVYEHMLAGESKDEAIRNMQLDYLKSVPNSEKAFPFYWAAYQCQGDLKPLFKKRTMSTLALMTFLPLFIFIFIGISTYLFPVIFLKKPSP
ncbi:MAG: CHAT domain-containing protein [Saprospiraceae bacterium]